jgi:hypothetical protein
VWFNASRPLSDVAGLTAAVGAQALLFTAWRHQRRQATLPAGAHAIDPHALMASGRLIVLGALAAGLAIGVRSQTLWLTLPVLVLVLADRTGRGAAGALLGSAVTFTAGVLLWAVPLVWTSGGLRAYVLAVSGQAGEDLSGVDMLARNPTVQRLAAGLVDTFVDPWGAIWLAAAVLALAAAGMLAMARGARPGLLLLLVAAVPYAVFHLTFHETFTTRYALPVVPVVAYLAVRGLALAGTLATAGGAAALAGASLALTVPPLAAYARLGSPVARGVADLREGLNLHGPRDRVLIMNHPFSIALRDENFEAIRLPSVRTRQWLELVKYWRNGGEKPIWFMAEPGVNGLERHHELALVDPASRQLRRAYRWPFDPTTFVGGARPSEVDWYELTPPGWVATQGWALTPEIAGVSRADGRGPAQGGIEALVRRRQESAVVLVGGRNLGRASDAPEVEFRLAVDGRPVRTWRVLPQPGFFLDLWMLEPGTLEGDGRYATLTVAAVAADGSGRGVEAAVEQFDLQPPSAVVYGFDRGWHEQEFAPATGRLWRWTAREATVRVHAAGGPLRCTIRGESSRRYFDRASVLVLRAGPRVLGERRAEADFDWEVAVPADALAASGGVLTLATDQTFVPDERSGNGDRRELGVRIYEFRVSAASAHSR